MYKIRELAKILEVETVEIHKKLLSLKKELTGHIEKNNGIISIDEEGMKIISLSLTGKKTAAAETETVNSEEKSDLLKNTIADPGEEGGQASSKIAEAPEEITEAFEKGEELQEKIEENSTVEDPPQPFGDREPSVDPAIPECKNGTPDPEHLKELHFSKKAELNSVNQQIMNEMEKTKNYTKELRDVYDQIARITLLQK